MQNLPRRKTYMSYNRDRAALARIIKACRRTDPNYSEADAIREALVEKEERLALPASK